MKRKSFFWRFSFFLLFLFVLGGGVFEEAAAKRKKSRKKSRRVRIDFDDELHIKGKLLSPSIFTLIQKKNINYGKLIRLRKDFLPEMRETMEDIK